VALDHTPPKSDRPIFRAEAVTQYVRSREEVILPRYVSRRTIILLWTALGVIMVGAAALLSIPLPLYTSGTAVSPQGGDLESGSRKGSLTVSITAEALAQVRPGQAAYVRGPDGRRRFAGRVVESRGSQSSRNGGVRHAMPSADGADAAQRPGAIVLIELVTGPGAPPAPACRPNSCRIDIRIGAPRAVAFFAPGELRTGN